MAEQVVIEFISDTSQLAPAVDKLTALGAIDEKSAAIFKATNATLKDRNALLQTTVNTSEEVTQGASDQQAIYNKLTSSIKNLSGASKDAVQNLLKLSQGDLAKMFQDGSLSIDDYIADLQSASKANDEFSTSTNSIKTQLRAVINELAALTLAGETEGKEFADLALKAGRLQNALQDTRQTVGNLGSDVPTLKVFAAGVQGITGAFTAATGASVLFGDDNKELQEVLVKVNAVMAINAGLSEVLNVLRDEAAISTAKVLIQERLNNAAIAVENGLQSESVIVRGAATVAQYALNLAMSLNPVGLVVIALASFITAIAIYTINATKAAKAQAELNSALEAAGAHLDAEVQGFDNANKKILADLDARNARQSELQAVDIQNLKATNNARLREIDRLNTLILKNQDDTNSDVQKLVKESRDKVEALESQAYDTRTELAVKETGFLKQQLVERLEDQANAIQGQLSLAVKNSAQEFALERQLAVAKSAIEIQAAGDDAQKVFAIRSALARELKDIDIAQAAEAQKVIAAALESALIKAQNESRAINDRQSKEEVDKQKAIILEQAAFEITQEGLKAAQKKAITDKANQQVIELQRQFDQQAATDAIQDQISANNKVLAQVNIAEKDKLDLRIQNIILAASAEIEQNRGKIAKIKEIEAQRDADIKAARLASIQDTLQKELALQEAQEAGAIRNIEKQLQIQDELRNATGVGQQAVIEKQLSAQRLSVQEQIGLVDQLTNYKLDSDQKEIDANDKAFAQQLISEQDYTVKSEQLADKAAKDFEDGEKRKTEIVKSETAKRIEKTKELISTIAEVASQAVGVLQTIYQQDGQAAQARIDSQRQAIQDLSDAGAITAKEASARNKKLDVEQKQLQYQQAKRDKEIAIFNAIINTARAVAAALPNLILAGIAGAIGLAEVAVIARQPLPQFGKGKKGNYTGFAEVGETGPELISRGGKMQLAEKSTITWLGPSDKVFNPKETAAMIAARVPDNYYPGNVETKTRSSEIDYDRLGKAVGDNIPTTGIGFDEQGLYRWTQRKQSFTKYLNKRRSWR